MKIFTENGGIKKHYKEAKNILDIKALSGTPGKLCKNIAFLMKTNILVFKDSESFGIDFCNIKAVYPAQNDYKLLILVEYSPDGKKRLQSRFCSIKLSSQNTKVILVKYHCMSHSL